MGQLISKKDMLLENFSRLNTGVIKFVGVTRREALKPKGKAQIRKPRKGQTDETIIPDRYLFVDKYTYNTAKVGTSYAYEVNKQRDIEGTNTTFRSKKTYCHPISDNLLVYQHNDDDRLYFRLYPSLCDKSDTITIYIDAEGNILSKQEFEEVERKYLQKWLSPEAKAKQAKNQGVKKSILVNNYGFDNIKWVELGGQIILNELDDKTLDILTK